MAKKNLFCRIGWHDWEDAESESVGGYLYFKRVCMRDGCDAVDDDISWAKERLDTLKERKEKAKNKGV